jgi:hypothetical protein
LPLASDVPYTRPTAAQEPSPRSPVHPAAQPQPELSSAGYDDRWPVHDATIRVRRTDPSTSALCTAISESLRYEQSVSGRQSLAGEPPFRPLDVRERTMWFMAEYSNTILDSRLSISARTLFRRYCQVDAIHLTFDHTDEVCSPTSWSEYQTLMADDGTYPDIIFLHVAARLYQCQIILFLENNVDAPYIVAAPPNAFRRIFLLASNNLQHINWAHPTHDRNHLDITDISFQAPNLSFPPTASEEHEEVLHTLYRRLPASVERLRQMHLAHNGYSGHPGVERTVKLLMAVGSRWRGMTADVAQFIRRCPTCCASRLKLQYAPVSASSLRLHARPLSRWHIDSSGAMSTCAFTGFTRLIVFICETTQFTLLFGSRHGTALETAIALVQLMGLFDLPESIHSDHGSENDNYIWHQMQQITGIKHTFSLPYIPQTNGIAERNIGSAKHFVRNLCTDIGRHNSWGLLLPIAQKGLNSLPREQLNWFSPAQIIFASCHHPEQFSIPTFYSRNVREMDIADAHAYHVSGNYAHRAMIFQQSISNHFHHLKDCAFAEAAARDPSAFQDLHIGQAVLVDWPDNVPPTPLHPRKQGPFRVVAIQRNLVVLQHLVIPPPEDQPEVLQWSKQAHVYTYHDAYVPERSDLDPSSSMTSIASAGRQIECVLSHKAISSSQQSQSRIPRHHVSKFEYTCRLFAANLPDASISHMLRVFLYDDIKHTYAFDCYVLAHRSLEGHVPVSHMPLTWQPHAVAPSLRPSHVPCPIHEHRLHGCDSSDTSAFST